MLVASGPREREERREESGGWRLGPGKSRGVWGVLGFVTGNEGLGDVNDGHRSGGYEGRRLACVRAGCGGQSATPMPGGVVGGLFEAVSNQGAISGCSLGGSASAPRGRRGRRNV
jgi:hypothetical protein